MRLQSRLLLRHDKKDFPAGRWPIAILAANLLLPGGKKRGGHSRFDGGSQSLGQRRVASVYGPAQSAPSEYQWLRGNDRGGYAGIGLKTLGRQSGCRNGRLQRILALYAAGYGETVWLFGFESAYSAAVARKLPSDFRLLEYDNPPRHFDARAFYFIRKVEKGTATYAAKEISDPRKPTLVSVRAIAVSPFPEDHGLAFYFGGYDCNKVPSHNTAWIYRAEINKPMR